MTDSMFSGTYRGKSKHDPDLDEVLERAWANGVDKMLVTAGCLAETAEAAKLAEKDDRLFFTVGVHPTRAGEFDKATSPEAHVAALMAVIDEAGGKVKAIGECGLDADRTHFCSMEAQARHFPRHFELAEATGLPMFFHSRGCHDAFIDIVRSNRDRFRHGVVHSFTGSAEEAKQLMELDLYIGVNGCSLKTAANLEVVKTIPLHRMMLETDAPWCGVKRTHAGFEYVRTEFPTVKKPEKKVPGHCVKDRCEPCHIRQVAEVVAALHGVSVEEVAAVTTANATRVFFS